MNKIASDIVPGDRLVMGDGTTKTVKTVSPGFVRHGGVNSKRAASVLITFTDGEWSQVRQATRCKIAP